MSNYLTITQNGRYDVYSYGERERFLASWAVCLIEVLIIASLCVAYYNYPSVTLKYSCIVTFVLMCAFNHFVPMNYSGRFINRMDYASPLLGSFFGIGTTMFRAYRSFGGQDIRYQFLTVFYIPIIPLGCYSAEMCDWEFNFGFPFFGFRKFYAIDGVVKPNALEILNIYLRFAIFVGAFYWFIISWAMDKIVWLVQYFQSVYA